VVRPRGPSARIDPVRPPRAHRRDHRARTAVLSAGGAAAAAELMSPTPLRTRAFWSSGGVIVGRCGPLSATSALNLFRFFGREALEQRAQGDVDAARCCLRLALDLAGALVAAADWKRAAGGDCCPDIDPLRVLGEPYSNGR